MAERARFELAVPFRVRPLSRRVPSTTRPPLRFLLNRSQSGDCVRTPEPLDCTRIAFEPRDGWTGPESNHPTALCIHNHFQGGLDLRTPGILLCPVPTGATRRNGCPGSVAVARNVNVTPATFVRGSKHPCSGERRAGTRG